MHPRIEQVLLQVQTCQKVWDDLFTLMRDGGLQLDRSYSSLQNSTLNELNDRLTATFMLADSISSMDESGAVLLQGRLHNIEGPLTQIHQQSEAAVVQFKNYPDSTFNDPSGTLQIQVTQGGSVITTLGLNSYLDIVAAQQTVLLDQLTLGLRFGRFKGAGLFHARARELQEIATQLNTLLSDSNLVTTKLNKVFSDATATAEQVATGLVSVTENAKQISDIVPIVKEAATEIDTTLTKVRVIETAADALGVQVTAYETSFTLFQESLDTRIRAHEKFERDMGVAMAKNSEREVAIDALIAKADTMIRGATTAGLSLSLDETKEEYETRLSRTGWWFLGSVAILFVCLLPIAGQLVPGPWQEWFKPVAGGNTDPWLATLGKIILLLPATWATAFFAGNYAELFHLSREYAHKAALAKAVDGFKREAPEYKEEIVAGVFMEIRDNPGSRKSPEPASPQNPLTQRILERLLNAIKAKQTDAK